MFRVFIFLLAILPSYSFSQYSIENFSTANSNLPYDYITDIVESYDGNIWVATYGAGIGVYDGSKWQVINYQNSMIGDTVYDLFVANDSSIWIANYYGGIHQYKNGIFKHYYKLNGEFQNKITQITQDYENNIWISTIGNGIYKLWNGVFYNYNIDSGLVSNKVYSISIDKKNVLWIGTDNGLNTYENGKLSLITTNDGIIDNDINSITIGNKLRIIVSTWKGVSVLNSNGEWINYSKANGLSEDWVWYTLEDKSQNLWFGMHSKGIIRYDNSNFHQIDVSDGLISNNVVSSIFEDSKNNFWIGTQNGLSKLKVNSGLALDDSENFNLWCFDKSLYLSNLYGTNVYIYNIQGAQILNIHVKSEFEVVNLQSLSRQILFYRINDDENTMTGKLFLH